MDYSSYGMLALLVYVIIDKDVLFRLTARAAAPVQRAYRNYLIAVMCYFVTDILWGVLDYLGLIQLLYADTVVYYVAMAASVLMWTKYVIAYLDERHSFELALKWAGRIFFVALLLVSLVNFSSPILFWFDEQGVYHAGIMRHVFLIVQVVLFLVSASYTLSMAHHSKGAAWRRRKAIGLFGLAMSALVVAQFAYPLMPLYSAGCLLGGCVLHSFVVEDEREEYLVGLETLLDRERQHKKELEAAMRLANTDPLTGARSRHAFAEAGERMDRRIFDGKSVEFAVVVCDLNDLKHVNDTLGHEAGDAYLKEACQLICDGFKHSPVFRIGGDEFAVLLEGDDFLRRDELLDAFDQQSMDNLEAGGVVIAAGMATFDRMRDESFRSVFIRADQHMYRCKDALKRTQGGDDSSRG